MLRHDQMASVMHLVSERVMYDDVLLMYHIFVTSTRLI